MQNWQATVYSQYSASQVIIALIQSFNDATDPSASITAFYNLMWNVLTAQGYGLDVWGRIVGVSRVVPVPTTGQFLGFTEAGSGTWQPFGSGVFYAGVPANAAYALSDQAFQLLILAKALANVSRASSSVYNAILRELFPGRGNAYVTDQGNMQATLVFEFALQPFELSVVKYSGAIRPPNGVGFQIMIVPQPPTPGGPGGTFGFHEAGYSAAPFGQGTFFPGFS